MNDNLPFTCITWIANQTSHHKVNLLFNVIFWTTHVKKKHHYALSRLSKTTKGSVVWCKTQSYYPASAACMKTNALNLLESTCFNICFRLKPNCWWLFIDLWALKTVKCNFFLSLWYDFDVTVVEVFLSKGVEAGWQHDGKNLGPDFIRFIK